MNAKDIMDELKALGKDSYRTVLLNHGIPGACYGVKIEELKKIVKRVGTDHRLALELYDSGVYDAMYLAGLIADDARMSKKDLNKWVKKACAPLAGSTVAWVAAGSPHGWQIAREWIDSKEELTAVAGWATLSALVSTHPDQKLDIAELRKLVQRVERTIHDAPDKVRYEMNGFVIAVGSFVKPLTSAALAAAEKIGKVEVDMGNTACKVPFAPGYIQKVEARGAVGKKRKSAKC